MPESRISAVLVPGIVTFVLLFTGWGITKIVERSRTPAAPSKTSSPSASPLFALSPLPAITLPPPRTDTDADGLPDELEAIYHSDPDNPDTDGDGYRDGIEVTKGYDPTKPSPGDKLTAEIRASPSPLPPPTLTEQFLSRTGPPQDPRSVLQSDALTRFVEEANARETLPDIPDASLKIVSGGGTSAVARYLDAVSVPQNTRMTAVSVEQILDAFTKLTKEKNDRPMSDIIEKLSRNVDALKKAPAPAEVIALHKRYVAASQALQESAEALLAYQTDYVGALAAASRIENLRSTFQEVAKGILDLERKYGIR